MNVPSEMIEIAISAFGDSDVLRPVRVATPTPSAGELLVRVAAAGVNRPDILQRQGQYLPPTDAQPTLGLEIAGEVVAVGEGVLCVGVGVGDRVCGLTNGGGYAEYCRLPAGQALRWPTGFDAVQAAALPETFFTVWANLFQIGKVCAGDTVLVHGGTSGIGTTAIQLLRAFGIRALATAGSAAKCAAILAIGGDVAINYREQDFVEVVRAETNGRGVDAILDIVGASYLQANIAALAMDGRLLLLGFLGGAIAQRLDLAEIMAKRVVITGSAMRPRTAAEKAAIAQDLDAKVWPLLGPGRVEPIIAATFPLERAADAHRLMESSTHIGKIVLRVEG